jgi:hypothetical protein
VHCSLGSVRQAKRCQPMTGEKRQHSSAQADKTQRLIGFRAATIAEPVTSERVSLRVDVSV